MPFVTNQGVRIHYVVEGNGPPVMLIHAFSGNHTSWIGYGFVAALRERFQLILPDVRAHGQSDGPADPASYTLDNRAADLIAVLDDLGIERAHVLGYSMGGQIGYALAQHYPERVRSLAVGGMSPYATSRGDTRRFLLQLYEQAAREGVEALIAGMRAWAGGTITPEYEARLWAANVAGGAALLRWSNDTPADFSAALPAMTLPCLLYCGEGDEERAGMQRAAGELPNARWIALPGMNHVQAAGASAELAPELSAFWDNAG
jgi:pimeloyl-ACP methyl ester carboxylesterase